MNQAIETAGRNALLLPTQSVMPLPWNDSVELARRRDDSAHLAHVEPDCWSYMLSNNTIRSDVHTRHLAYMPAEVLLTDRSFLGCLLRRALYRPPIIMVSPRIRHSRISAGMRS